MRLPASPHQLQIRSRPTLSQRQPLSSSRSCASVPLVFLCILYLKTVPSDWRKLQKLLVQSLLVSPTVLSHPPVYAPASRSHLTGEWAHQKDKAEGLAWCSSSAVGPQGQPGFPVHKAWPDYTIQQEAAQEACFKG